AAGLGCRGGRGRPRAARPGGPLRGRLCGRGRARGSSPGGRARGGRGGRDPRRRRLEVPFGALLGRGRSGGGHGGGPLVVVPDEVRLALEEHSRTEAPNEACGLLVLRAGVAERYERGRNLAASPYRFELDVDPAVWSLED